MRVNVDKVLERDSKLSELDDRADALQAGASQFETNAAKLKRKYWWKNCKARDRDLGMALYMYRMYRVLYVCGWLIDIHIHKCKLSHVVYGHS